MTTTNVLSAWADRAEIALQARLPEATEHGNSLADAMRYASLGGGKRLRAALVYATGEMLGASPDRLDIPAAAVEMIHAYSLVHDDLPAMDDDDLRRGKPTCHKVFGDAMAILAGDALQCLAFEVLSTDTRDIEVDVKIEMIKTLASSSGFAGMAGGQALDLAAVGSQLDVDALSKMHGMKTGALIRASVRLGALAGDADSDTLARLDNFAGNIGLAFQIVDDILDEMTDSDTLGKTVGSDRANCKPTYTTMLGIAAARDMANRLEQTALESLAAIGHNTEVLSQITTFITRRSH